MWTQAGTCVMRRQARADGAVDLLFYWTSNASGAVTVYLDAGDVPPGYLYALHTNPVDSPTDNYGVTFTDGQGVDLLRGVGANRDTTTSETAHIVDSSPSTSAALPMVDVASGPFTFAVASAGNAKSGLAILTVLPMANEYTYGIKAYIK